MGARILWAGNQAVHAASCPCILCRADRMKPELPTARLVPPWWIRVWSVWAVVAFLGCRTAPTPEPVIFNRAEPSSVPVSGKMQEPKKAILFVNECHMMNSRPFCVFHWMGLNGGSLRCGCCPPAYPMWACKRMF